MPLELRFKLISRACQRAVYTAADGQPTLMPREAKSTPSGRDARHQSGRAAACHSLKQDMEHADWLVLKPQTTGTLRSTSHRRLNTVERLITVAFREKRWCKVNIELNLLSQGG
jgi:hypothetical protein